MGQVVYVWQDSGCYYFIDSGLLRFKAEVLYLYLRYLRV